MTSASLSPVLSFLPSFLPREDYSRLCFYGGIYCKNFTGSLAKRHGRGTMMLEKPRPSLGSRKGCCRGKSCVCFCFTPPAQGVSAEALTPLAVKALEDATVGNVRSRCRPPQQCRWLWQLPSNDAPPLYAEMYVPRAERQRTWADCQTDRQTGRANNNLSESLKCWVGPYNSVEVLLVWPLVTER